MISNDDLTIECRQLKEKLSETEEEMENLRAGKLGEKEKSNSLACELALSQADLPHPLKVRECPLI